jgi:RNA polymerase sigma-70 factor (ECF subfamily)
MGFSGCMNRSHRGSAVAGVVGSDHDRERVLSFEEIYDAYYGTVARWIRYLGGATADREDLVQEVFLIVYRRLRDFDGRNTAGWLYRITANQVRDYQRLAWIKHVFRRKAALSPKTPSLEPSPIMTLEARERQHQLEQLLGRLSSALRLTFILFEIEGYTAEEIAEMQSLETSAVRSRIHRARKKLTAILESSAQKHSSLAARGRRELVSAYGAS